MGIALLLTAGVAPATAAAEAPGTGTNVALAANGGSVQATGQEVAGQWGPDLVIDGVINKTASGRDQSRWSSNQADDAAITVKLGAPEVIDHIAIQWEAACAAKYKLQVSTDGASFVDATDVIAPTCGTRDVQKISKVDADAEYQYVRMQGIDRTPINGTKWGMSMWEFEVWNGAEPVIVPNRTIDLVPLPQNVAVQKDIAPFTLEPDARIVAAGKFTLSANFLAELLRTSTGYALPVVASSPTVGDIVFTDAAVAGVSGDEAYGLDVATDRVTITATADHGAFNGVQTLRQLLPAFVESDTVVQANWSAPAVRITDAPRFGHRATMLDVARSFLTVDEVKSFLDTMAAFKISTLHFHLADDQGWRLEITNDGKVEGDPIDYTQLTKRSGATGMTERGYQNELGRTGFYTQKQYKELVDYAAALHIEVVPEIDTPGHTNAALHAVEELNTKNTRPGADESGRAPANGTGNVGYSTLDANSDLTWTFMRHVIGQVADLTPGEYIHVGGDESAVTPHDDYVTFITKSVEIVHENGKKMMGWNESAIGGVKKDDAIQYWTGGTADTLKAVKEQGAKLVISRGTSAYLDMKYNSKTPIGLTWAGTGDFPKYYDWDPADVVTDGSSKMADENILGVEGPMWAETIRGVEQAQFLAFPRTISHAEIGWTPQGKRNVTDFTARMSSVGERLLAMGTNFYDGAATAWKWSSAGLPVAVAPGRNLSLSVATVAAPGTKATADGAGIAVDRVDDEDGLSASAVSGSLSATIDWGDGSARTSAVFRTDAGRTSLSAGGLYTLKGTHAYGAAGSYNGTATFSDGTTTSFTAKVAAGTADPAEPDQWDSSVTPGLDVAPTVTAGDRLSGKLTGFQPGSYVTITIGDRNVGTVRPQEDGSFTLSLPVVPETYTGKYSVTATAGTRTASDEVSVSSTAVQLTNRLDSAAFRIVDVDSEETAGEKAGAAKAIDGDPNTFWHTQWQGGSPAYPHWITIDLGAEYDVTGFGYTQRPGQPNGRIKDYEVYVSGSATEFGEPVEKSAFLDIGREQVSEFDTPVRGRYLKLVGLSSVSGNAFGGAAEISVGGVVPGAAVPTLELGAESVQAGQKLTLAATGLAPDTVTVAQLLPTSSARAGAGVLLADDLRTDADGRVEAEVTIPADVSAGAYTVSLTQSVDGASIDARAQIAVTAAPGDGGPGDGGPGDGENPDDGGTGGTPGAGGTTSGTGGGAGTAGNGGFDGDALATTGGSLTVGAMLAGLFALTAGAVLALRRRRVVSAADLSEE